MGNYVIKSGQKVELFVNLVQIPGARGNKVIEIERIVYAEAGTILDLKAMPDHSLVSKD